MATRESRIRPRARSIVALLMLLATAEPVLAGSGTATLSVTVSVTHHPDCTISATPIAFATYDPIVANQAAPLDATGSVTLRCSKGTSSTVALDGGLNSAQAVGATRAMKSGTSDYLSYEIYQDSGRTTVWGDIGGGLFVPPVSPNSSPRTYSTYGRIPAGQDVPAGASYTDTVTATVNF